jgi:mycothiol synthase
VRPPQPYTARPATSADVEAITAICNACEQANSLEPARFGERELEVWLGRVVATVVVTSEHGEAVACAGGVRRGPAFGVEGFVRPEHTGRGLGSFLVDWAEEQARQLNAEAVRVSVPGGDERARALLESRGYTFARSFYRMVIELPEPPPPPQWPDGVTVAPLRADEERLLHKVLEDAFAEHWGHVARSIEEWRRALVLEHDLTFLARAGDEVAGAVVCNEELFGVALVGILGVRRSWRGRGLGRALLLHGFGALYARGKRRIGLAVDAGNETGAVRLYESVGMRVGAREDVHERRVAGADPSPAAQV